MQPTRGRAFRELCAVQFSGRAAALALVTGLAWGVSGPAAESGDDAVQTALRQIIPEIKYDGTPFEDVVADLRKRTGVNIHIQQNDLTANGVELSAAIHLWLRDVPAGRVLDLVLSDMDVGARVSAQVRDGVLVIASAEKNDRRKQPRTYVVRDILFRTPDDARRADLDPEFREQRAGELVDVIRSTIDAESWRDTGAGDGAIRFRDGQIVVYNHAGLHEAVARLLNAMRSPASAEGAPISANSEAGGSDDRVRAALARPLKRVAHKSAPLDRVLSDIATQAGVNIFVRWHEWAAAGIERDVRVSVELSNLPAARILSEVLDDIGDVSLAYEVDGGIVVVSTREWREKQITTRLYHLPERLDFERSRELIDVITQTVNPDSWTDGGGIANLAVFDSFLIAQQSAGGHRQLHDLLEQLRQMKHAATRPAQTPPFRSGF